MTIDAPFQRPISATERLYITTQSLAPPFAIQLVVTGSGEIDPAALEVAVDQASAACPGARLRRNGRNWVDSRRAPQVKIVDHAIDFADLDDDPILQSSLGSDDLATTEVVVARAASETSVVFRAFHGVMDAKGLQTWASEIFRVLRGQEPIGAPDVTADHDLVARVGTTSKPTTLLPTRRAPLGAAGRPPRTGKFVWRHRAIPSTTPAVVARICADLADVVGSAARFMVPVDLRRHDPAIRSTANLALPLFVDVDPGVTWQQVHAQILTRLADRRELAEMDNGGLARLPGPVTRAIVTAAHRIGARMDRNLVSAIVSHAGQIDLEDFSTPGFTAATIRALPVHTGLVPMSFVIVETGASTEITVSCRAGDGVNEQLDALLDRLTVALAAPAAAPLDPVEPALPIPEAMSGVDTAARGDTADSRFRYHAERTPEAMAVSGPDGERTYRQLDDWADAIAALLISHDVGPGSIVAILAGRTPAAMAGQLGVMRTGAAFLSLDPKHPTDRLTAILEDSRARILLTAGEHSHLVPTDTPTMVLEDLPRHTDTPVTAPISGDDIAYVTYTSGSTGRPKGVLVPHRGIVNFVDAAIEWWSLGPDTRFAHHHTPAADMACAAFFSSLLAGGSITLVPEDISHLSLRAMLVDSGANTFLLTPSLLEVVLRLDITRPTARTVIIGGERLLPGLATRARGFFGAGTRLLNSYGPAELAVACTTHIVGPAPDPDAPSVPIGRPAVNTPVFLLDDQQRPVAAGEIGELCFGGPQVARGYLGRPELTAGRFITLPGGERVYRTGDLGRVLPNQSLDFVGRVDDQVKIRGNRVEPGEVQAVLEQMPGAGQVAVVARPTEAGGNALVAYLVADDDVDISATREYLREHVPTYMIPAAFHTVDALPLTANGKIDLARLPGIPDTGLDVPTVAQPSQGADAEGTEVERIATIWASILQITPGEVTPDADFFALGGDSLASLEMLSQVSTTIVGPDGEARFVEQLEGLINDMTLTRVHAAAVAARGAAA
ncbi:non-ribosomal peptide synthetase [Rhodococcus spongiicola]|uniref:Amino acid adenylation domain-containing protein n=1 Tax=Rhodococcus spongiicola TaxID=2487352 RepID=A0A3S3AAC0_9NOCA|nr:non-ribosomal peptide synthetase [Rhodococcus spongiicola]RVW03394.1 amino acid adenylation domain-containing protein [Rhodococcus spongiicola]